MHTWILLSVFVQPKLQLRIWKPWRWIVLCISGLITSFHCCYFTLFSTVPLLYIFYVNFHCKIIVRAVSSLCTIVAEWRTPSLETWLWYNNKQRLTEAPIFSIYYFPRILGWKPGGLAWKHSLFVKFLKNKSPQKSTKTSIFMSSSVAGGYVFTFPVSVWYPKHTGMF